MTLPELFQIFAEHLETAARVGLVLTLAEVARRLGGGWTLDMVRRHLKKVGPQKAKIKLPGLTVPAFKQGKAWYVWEAHLTAPSVEPEPEVRSVMAALPKRKAALPPSNQRKGRYIDTSRSGRG